MAIHHAVAIAAKGRDSPIARRHVGGIGEVRRSEFAIDRSYAQSGIVARGRTRGARRQILLGQAKRIVPCSGNYQRAMRKERLEEQPQPFFDVIEHADHSWQLSGGPLTMIEPDIGEATNIRHDSQAEVDDKATDSAGDELSFKIG